MKDIKEIMKAKEDSRLKDVTKMTDNKIITINIQEIQVFLKYKHFEVQHSTLM